jgi:hypothetical protein
MYEQEIDNVMKNDIEKCVKELRKHYCILFLNSFKRATLKNYTQCVLILKEVKNGKNN